MTEEEETAFVEDDEESSSEGADVPLSSPHATRAMVSKRTMMDGAKPQPFGSVISMQAWQRLSPLGLSISRQRLLPGRRNIDNKYFINTLIPHLYTTNGVTICFQINIFTTRRMIS